MVSAAPLVLILAGGEGSRIGGGKPMRRLGAETLIGRAARLAQSWSDEVRIAVRRGDQVGPIGVPLLADSPEIEGPLGGLAAGLRRARALGRASLLTLPCDMPFVPPDLTERLAAAMDGHNAAVAASGGELHPVCALWRTEALDFLEDYLATGRRSLRGFADAAGHVAVEWDSKPLDPFFNINSEADLRAAEVFDAARSRAARPTLPRRRRGRRDVAG